MTLFRIFHPLPDMCPFDQGRKHLAPGGGRGILGLGRGRREMDRAMKGKLVSRGLLMALVMGAGLNAAQAASFDCRKARTADEVAVCSDPLLSELDDIMADFYRRLRHYTQNFDNAMGLQAQLVDEARDFLRRRADCGDDRTCLEQTYRTRILELLRRWETVME